MTYAFVIVADHDRLQQLHEMGFDAKGPVDWVIDNDDDLCPFLDASLTLGLRYPNYGDHWAVVVDNPEKAAIFKLFFHEHSEEVIVG